MMRALRPWQVISRLLLPLLLVSPVVAEESPMVRLSKLLDDAWEFQLREDPVFATRFGDHRWDDRLSSESLADQQRRLEQRRQYLIR